MMDLHQIETLAGEAAARAAREHLYPYTPFDEAEVQQYGAGRPFPFPNLGGFRPRGWLLVETLFCDGTGCGLESERALTVRALRERLLLHQREGRQYGYAIVEEGQFQVYIGVFERRPKTKRTKKAADPRDAHRAVPAQSAEAEPK